MDEHGANIRLDLGGSLPGTYNTSLITYTIRYQAVFLSSGAKNGVPPLAKGQLEIGWKSIPRFPIFSLKTESASVDPNWVDSYEGTHWLSLLLELVHIFL